MYAKHSTPHGTFGYEDMYNEYRHMENMVHGEFKEGGTQTDWHMGRIFASNPALNASFVESNPTNRIYADQTAPQIYGTITHKIRARRQVARRMNPKAL